MAPPPNQKQHSPGAEHRETGLQRPLTCRGEECISPDIYRSTLAGHPRTVYLLFLGTFHDHVPHTSRTRPLHNAICGLTVWSNGYRSSIDLHSTLTVLYDTSTPSSKVKSFCALPIVPYTLYTHAPCLQYTVKSSVIPHHRQNSERSTFKYAHP